MRTMKTLLLSLVALTSLNVSAQPLVEDAWVRATVAGQQATGAFMRITSPVDSKLVEAQSPVAKTVQIHQSKMVNDIMSMQPVAAVALPAGVPVDITPEGYHIMLIDLNAQVKDGDKVPLTLILENADGTRESVAVSAQARSLTTHDHHSMH